MPKFYTTTSFRADLAKYLKKDSYANCKQDICDFFKNKTITQIAAQPILLSGNNGFLLIKSRLPNTCFNTGKSGGYRLYHFVHITTENVYLIGFYPKTGKYGAADLTNTQEKMVIKQFTHEKNMGTLIAHDVNDKFTEIDPNK